MIVCGWCNHPTEPGVCRSCGRDPALPWTHRAMDPPTPAPEHVTRLAEAAAALGPHATIAQVAEFLDVSDRTVRRWREMSA